MILKIKTNFICSLFIIFDIFNKYDSRFNKVLSFIS